MNAENYSNVIAKAHFAKLEGVTLRVMLCLLYCVDDTGSVLMRHLDVAEKAGVNRGQVTVAVRQLRQHKIVTTSREKGGTRFIFI